MKIARLTSPPLDVLRLSSPRPKIRHGRRLALLSRPNLILNLCALSFALSLAILSPLQTLPTVPIPGSWLRSSPITGDPTFLSPNQRPWVLEPEATFPSSAEPCALRSLICPFAHPAEFLAAASNLSSSTATGPDKVAYLILKYFSRSGMDFLHIFNLFWSQRSFPSIWKTSSIIPIHRMGKPLCSPASFQLISLTTCA